MKKTALIISHKFRAAHISHLIASYRQMKELGWHSVMLIDKNFIPYLPADIEYITELKEIRNVDLAIFWFPALQNIKTMIQLKLYYRAKIIYVYHEPIESFKSYLQSGNSIFWTCKFYTKYIVSLSFIFLSNKIILPSNKAIKLYQSNTTKYLNNNYCYLPLLYEDECIKNESSERLYISYIGGISYDHAYDKYVDFIYTAYKNNDFPHHKFLIASWRTLWEDKRISEMTSVGKLVVFAGTPMSNEEINKHYAQSIIVWNAYNRSTQSGVLAKSFMFGTPGLVLRKNISEFVQDRREVIAIEDNTNYNQIKSAIDYTIDNIEQLSKAARLNFERNYNYKSHNEQMSKILNSLT